LRRRLALLSLATTALVVIALLVPLGLLVRRQAADGARDRAETSAQSLAALMGVALSLDASARSIESAIGPLGPGEMIVFSDGTTFGESAPGQGSLVVLAMANQSTITSVVDGGWEMALSVVGREGAAVVDVFVSEEELFRGVGQAWALLAALGVVLVAAAVLVADRLGASLVTPIKDLAAAAHRMGDGDLDARVVPEDPEEVREVGEAFNHMAVRLSQLLIDEREAVADLSHRLRTPLTSLRLQAEKIGDTDDRAEVLNQVDRLEKAIDQLIFAVRAGRDSGLGHCVLDEVVAGRAAFWKMLADEQGRRLTVSSEASGIELGMSEESVEAVLDALVGNVFSHTEPGTAFAVRTGETDHRPWLEVSDEGPGFPDPSLVGRGVSGRGSTGLGLDIARRTAELSGGELHLSSGPSGGVVVRVWFG
jgi:signal transduction histidine kinase